MLDLLNTATLFPKFRQGYLNFHQKNFQKMQKAGFSMKGFLPLHPCAQNVEKCQNLYNMLLCKGVCFYIFYK